MNAPAKIEATPLAKLREPFPSHLISKLPKPTKAQTDAVRADYKKGIRCQLCGAWHHPEVVHLDYVGHAALTDRLLDTDPEWSWEPVAVTELGLPAFDQSGGLWIRLTVCGVTRLGYGNAAQKPNQDPGNREKEVIGDALRNAAMRFGAALDLWHKGDLHADEEVPASPEPQSKGAGAIAYITKDQVAEIRRLAEAKGISSQQICTVGGIDSIPKMEARQFERCKAWIAKQPDPKPQTATAEFDGIEDEIPY